MKDSARFAVLLLWTVLLFIVIVLNERPAAQPTRTVSICGEPLCGTGSSGDPYYLKETPMVQPLPKDIVALIGSRIEAGFNSEPPVFINNADRAGELALLVRTEGIIRVIERVAADVDPQYRDQVYHSVDGLRAWVKAQNDWLLAHPEPEAHRDYEHIPPELYQ